MSGLRSTVVSEVIYLAAPGIIEFRAERLPRVPPSGALLCKTIVTAISPGTEIAAYNGLPPLHPGATYPRLVGYCNVSEVIAAGAAVKTVRKGDRVLSFTAHRSHAVIAEASVLYVLRKTDDADAVACAYLYHLGYNAVLRSGVRPGNQVIVLGLGTLGLTSVAMAVQAGAETLAISDQPAARALANEWGAQLAVPRQEIKLVYEWLGDHLADVVISTTNAWSDWKLALETAGQRATIACLGFPGREASEIPFNPLDSQYFYTKQLRIEAVGLSPTARDSRGFVRFDERSNLAYIVRSIAGGQLKPRQLVTGRFAAREIELAYRALIQRDGATVTFLLDWE